MREPLNALRVGSAHWLEDEAFARLLAFLARWPDAMDELAFFTSTTHAPLPLEEIKRRCERLARILPQARQHGYRAGVNVLTSMGHHEEDLPHSLSAHWPRVTDPEGRVSLGSFCPATPELLEYVAQAYTLVAQTKPDFIWVDDDVRLMGHMPIRATCFCDGCIARFSNEMGMSFTRPTLIAALNAPATTERDALRERWMEHNRALIRRLLATAAEAAHYIAPTIQMGFMTGDRFYEGYAFAEWANTLAGDDSKPARWRPGGGFYTDDEYMGMVDKAHAVGRQTSQLPPDITVVQSEIENFPYQRLRKSVATTMLEAAVHMAAGSTGTAFNILGMQPDPLDEYAPFLDRIAALRPFYKVIRDTLGRSPAVGVWPAWHRNLFADYGVEGDWLQHNRSVESLRHPYVLAELGLPIAYAPEGACITAMSGSLPAVFTTSELERIFRGGVLLDVPALQTLARLGLQEWAGVQVSEIIEHDMTEILSHHPLNGQFAGWSRDCRQSFWSQPAYCLAPVLPGVEILANLTDYAQQDLGPTMTAFENSLGGRIVVMGYYPWTLIHNVSKSSQLKSVCRWLSRETMPAVVESYARVVIWARTSIDGRLVLMILNASLDLVPDLWLRVRTKAPAATCQSFMGQSIELSTVADGNHHVRLVIHNVMPWTIYMLQF